MIRDYLGAVSTAATRKLPKGDRLLFVGRTRAAIEAKVGPLGSADADNVAAALTALGDPDELAAKERERLYSARRRGAAAEPPKLWKPPGKTGRRGTPPGKPSGGGPAGTPPPGGPADAQPRRSRSWPYRRSGAGDPALPGPAGPAETEPGAPGTSAPGSGATGSGPPAAAPDSGVHIPPPRQPEPPGPTVGPGMAGATGWLASPGTVGPGMPPGTAAPGGHGGTAGPGTGNGTAGPGTGNGTAGPGTGNGTAGPGTGNGTSWPGTPNRTVGPGTPKRTAGAGPAHGTSGPGAAQGTAGPGTPNSTSLGGQHSPEPEVSAPAGQAGETAPIPPVAAAGPSGQATRPEAAPADGTKPLSIVPGMDTGDIAGDEPAGRRFGPPAPLTEAWLLARKNPLEAVAIVLLGVGGLIFPVHPVPVWLLGGLLALRSRRWDKRDKWLALAGPVGFAVICLVLLGASGSGSFFHALGQATHQFAVLLRVGCVLCSGYLVWRLRRGPRRRKTPPWLRGR
jgi:hypothetical protein